MQLQLPSSRRHFTLLAAVLVGACSRDVTGPLAKSPATSARDASNEVERLTTRLAANRAKGIHTFDGQRGTSYVLDHATGILRGAKGQSVKLDARTLALFEKTFDHYSALDIQNAKFRQDPSFQAKMTRAARSKRNVMLRGRSSSTVPGPTQTTTPPTARGRGLTARKSASVIGAASMNVFDDGGPCEELELQIYAGTQAYNADKQRYEDLLASAVTLGWGWDANGSWSWNAERYATQLAKLTIALDVAAAVAESDRITLDYLAIQYELAGCWNQVPTPPQGTGGGSPGSTGVSGGGCHQEYVFIDESYDDGNSWSTVWEGWANVC